MSAVAREAAVEIAVADRGPGIPAGDRQRIFDPFFRGARALENQVRGFGLGSRWCAGLSRRTMARSSSRPVPAELFPHPHSEGESMIHTEQRILLVEDEPGL